jgi:arsenate reductase
MAPRYTGTFSPETVDAYVHECHELLGSRAAVSRHLPVLVERFAGQRLDALARTSGLAAKAVPEVLFVCTENAGRSQLAEALLRHAAAVPVRIHSAGTLPSADIDGVTRRLLAESGLPASAAFPKPLTTEIVSAADIVITSDAAMPAPWSPGGATSTGRCRI